MTESIEVAALVNGGTSTSFQLEVSVKTDQVTPADITVISFYDESLADVDPNVAEHDMDFISLGSSSRFDVNAYRQLRDLFEDCDILYTDYNFVRLIIETTIKTHNDVDGLNNYNEPTYLSPN